MQRETAEVLVKAGGMPNLMGSLCLPVGFKSIVLFAHGSGSSRYSPRNIEVAEKLNNAGFATLLFDLLTEKESHDRSTVFDIPLLARRLVGATKWLETQNLAAETKIAFFGASTGAAAALWAAAKLGNKISAVVSRGGRPDLALLMLYKVTAPTLLIVGEEDAPVIKLNPEAAKHLRHVEFKIIPRATHLFEEPGTLEMVSTYAKKWFLLHLEGESKQSCRLPKNQALEI